MGFKSSLELRIADAYPSDISKGWCRIHPITMEELDVAAGDPIEVTHDRGAIGSFCFPANQRRWSHSQVEEDAIHIKLGSLLCGPEIDLTGQVVTVSPISPPTAKEVIYQEIPPRTHPEVAALVTKENLVGTLVTTGARMAVYGKVDRGGGSGIQGIMPVVYETVPGGVVKISEDTNLDQRSNEGG